MQDNLRTIVGKGALPIILLAAVLQGWALYALHQAIKNEFWPATDPAWLIALYALVLFVPLTVQLLSEYARSRAHWVLLGVLGLFYFYFGWHHGRSVAQGPAGEFVKSGDFAPLTFIAGLLWLLTMPFVQARLSTGRWGVQYAVLFTTAWRNKLMLAEAALFTGLFWLLLMLWQMLFHMLGIDYFKELFEEPAFFYPITTIVFGIALHLIGSVERLTSAILEQLLNVLKWLAIVAGVILTLFTIALIFKLPGLMFHGEKAIGAAWLLWLVAVIVLLINAAFRDGSVERPYPEWIAFALRCIVPMTIVISLTALYALIVRARHYGITVERVWAFVVAGTALTYSIGYSISAVGQGPWLARIARVNVGVAVALIATIAASLTPLLSPYRLAASSQYRVSLENTVPSAIENENQRGDSSFLYLKFEAGGYGNRKLNELSVLKDHPAADRIRTAALAALAAKNRWQGILVDPTDAIDKMKLFPSDRQLDAKLRQKLTDDIKNLAENRAYRNISSLAGVFADLHDDKAEEFILLHRFGGSVYQHIGDEWESRGDVVRDDLQSLSWKSLLKNLDEGKVNTSIPDWKRLEVGPHRFRIDAPRTRGAVAVYESGD